MIRIFSHDNIFIVHNIKNILNAAGIITELRNDLINSAAGELPPTEVWPEIWIMPEQQQKAEALIKLAMQGDPSRTSWFCEDCNESNEPAFELCWHCGAEGPH